MPTRSLPRSVTELLARFRGCFTTPTFHDEVERGGVLPRG